jgi:hypothetical protein
VASRRKRLILESKRRRVWLRSLAIYVLSLVAIVFIFWLNWFVQTRQTTAVALEVATRASERFGLLMSNLSTAPDFQNYPENVRGKMLELASKNQRGELVVNMEAMRHPDSSDVLMSSETDGPKPRIVIHAPRYIEFESQNQQLFRSTVVVSLLHETIHLERWPEKSHEISVQESIEEEERAYSRTVLEVVRPMRQKGLWMSEDFIKFDEVLRSCNDTLPCSQFRQLVMSGYSRHIP